VTRQSAREPKPAGACQPSKDPRLGAPGDASAPRFDITGTWTVEVSRSIGVGYEPHFAGSRVIFQQNGQRVVGEQVFQGNVIASFDGYATGDSVTGNYWQMAPAVRRHVKTPYTAQVGEGGEEILLIIHKGPKGRPIRAKFHKVDVRKPSAEAQAAAADDDETNGGEGR